MGNLEIVLWCVMVIALIASPFMLIRNEWVLKKRLEAIDIGMDYYEKLESYDTCLYKFWIWDFDKFIKVKKDERDVW